MTLLQFNNLSGEELSAALFNCCGSASWVTKMLSVFPVKDEETLLGQAAEQWRQCSEADRLQAFSHHPKIGDIASLQKKFRATAQWAAGEQSSTVNATDEILQQLAEGNQLYEDRFGFIFIVCATGKTAAEMLELLNARLSNTREQEIEIAAAEQGKITAIRLKKLVT